MSTTENGECASGSPEGSISVYNFSEKLMEQVVHFHVMKLDGGFFLWVGTAPVLSNLAVSMSSKFDSTPLSSLVMGDPADPSSSTLAQRLTKRTKKQVFVSFNLPGCPAQLSLLVEERIKKELELHPEHF
ncbi:hypothetical protein AALO_G00122460 [Alosa alosa]|uniref:Proteasome assembly chaperone 4 n=1 Tax=Alosa alosa TaxID=278164 RepID=A0AAV6GKH7_9TELE|nr:proteasome assembly chaperone 4 [Alosa alosa]KAG5275623.1 hypothetical protein AALO_G00122460 [Alosa alosa]